MRNTHFADQAIHMRLPEHIPHEAIMFTQVQSIAFTGHHPGGILTTMLQYN